MLTPFAVVLALSLAGGPVADPFLALDGSHRWGLRQGLQIAVHPVAIGTRGDGGPRGLLRIGYPILPDGRVSLINFIAVEPTVKGRKGFSELERSADGRQGKQMTILEVRRERRSGRERLHVSLDVERFENGAQVRLEVVFDSSRPDEVELRAFALPESAAMDECILTATMGNYARVRKVYLADGVLDSSSAFSGFLSNGFTRHHVVPAGRLARDRSGDIVIPAVPDEFDPSIQQESLPRDIFWRYPGTNVTQYWKAPRGTYSGALELRLNGRRTYWMSSIPIPGGVSFENFELRDRFRSGQPFVFGVTRRTAAALLAQGARDDARREWLRGWD